MAAAEDDLKTEEAIAGENLAAFSCPIPIFDHKQIVLGHGSGGKLTADLIEKIFLPAFRNPTLDKLDDQAVLGNRVQVGAAGKGGDVLARPGEQHAEIATDRAGGDDCDTHCDLSPRVASDHLTFVTAHHGKGTPNGKP